jgi:uncharacterized protein (TIGR03546 family)
MLGNFKTTINGINTPHQLALGVTIGAVIGMVPKDSAIPYLFALLLLLSRGNLLCGILSAVCFSFLSPILDPISHATGLKALTVTAWQPFLAEFVSRPFIPWLRIENTIVTGSLIISLLASLPLYAVSNIYFRLWGIRMLERLSRLKIFGGFKNETPITIPDALATD